MTITLKLAAAAALAGTIAAPAAAQYAQPYPQTYPQQYAPNAYPQQAYPQGYNGYGYQQGYQQGYAQNPIQQVIDGLLGNRYNVTDRQAVSQCAAAVVNQAQVQYRYGYGQQGYAYGQGYGQRGYQQGFAAPSMRVTAITNVERRSGGLRVSGLLDSGRYAYAQGYNNGGAGDLSFRCNVDYRGAVTNIRIRQNNTNSYGTYRRY